MEITDEQRAQLPKDVQAYIAELERRVVDCSDPAAQATIREVVKTAAEDAAHDASYQTRMHSNEGELYVEPTATWAEEAWKDGVKKLVEAGILQQEE